jgi:hypothetical protein
LRGANCLDSLKKLPPVPACHPAITCHAACLTYDQRWGFGHDIHQPALTVATIPPSESINTGAMQEQDIAGISRLSPLLQTLPSLATSAHVASHQYMEVIINGPLASVKDGPGFPWI